MKSNLINQLADILENKITSRKYNNSNAAKTFRDAQCLCNDYRSVRIISNVFDFLIWKFRQGDGRIKLTNTSKNVGDIATGILNARGSDYSDARALCVGDFVLDILIENGYILLIREPYFRVEEVMDRQSKKKVNYNPYVLEMGQEFPKISIDPAERIGMSLKPYKEWKDGQRVTEGIPEKLVKSNVNIKGYENSQFMVSMNTLENVKWKINHQVADVCLRLKAEITDINITLQDFSGNDVVFNVSDINRLGVNSSLKGIDLYRNGDIFEPHRGNSGAVPALEKELEKQTIRLGKLKNEKKREETKENVHKLHKAFNIENLRWTDKQFCLRTQSQAARNKAIIETINGTGTKAGWLGYEFYQGMYLDYRGRIYNRDPYFSYQSSDLARGHFLFAEEKELTQEGVEYTFIHLASSFNQTYSIKELEDIDWLEADYITLLNNEGMVDISVDKMSVNDKHNWTVENMDMLLEIAEDPMNFQEVWKGAEKPWVFLSLCFELGGIIGSALTGEPYYSGMPIAIDGVNNGTQHLAAMSRDSRAGKLVGLVPMDVPKDFYLRIGKAMIAINESTEIGKKLRKIPMKLVRKGISKRGSMTRAYDAGARKIGEIIYQDSYDAGITSKYKLTRSDARTLGKDLVKAYDEVCTGPVHIKKYLQELVKYRIKSLGMKEVSWESPSGFPVLTQKWVARKRMYKGTLQGRQIGHIYLEVTDIPSTSEHLSAIGANWVHSYDAAHMSLVINALDLPTFGAIHDSYSVHACDVQQLIDTTKSQFIKMYSRDTFKDMRSNLIDNDEKFDREPPEQGDLILEDVLGSDFFFC
jgi:DNA-directed RNA polymerase